MKKLVRRKRKIDWLLKRQPRLLVKPQRMLRGSDKKLKKPRLLWRQLNKKHSLPEKSRKDKTNWLKRLKKKPREQG